MHTAHVYQGNKLLILGGRGALPGQSPEQASFHNNIFQVDLTDGTLTSIGTLPADVASHQSALIDDKYLVLYGGTNGLRFFDSLLRYSLEDKKWTLMTN